MVKTIFKSLLWILILAVLSILILFGHLLPPIAEQVIIEKIRSITGIESFNLNVETIGLSGVGVGDITTGESISVDSIFCSYSPASLIEKRIDRLTISGLEVTGVVKDSSFVFTDFPSAEQITDKESAEKKSELIKEPPAKDETNIKDILALLYLLPPVIQINNSCFTLNDKSGNSTFTLPFSLTCKIENSGDKQKPSVINLLLKPIVFGQKIQISMQAELINSWRLQNQSNTLQNPSENNKKRNKELQFEDIFQSISIKAGNISWSSLQPLIAVVAPDAGVRLTGSSDINVSMSGGISNWKIELPHIGMAKPIKGEIENVVANLTTNIFTQLIKNLSDKSNAQSSNGKAQSPQVSAKGSFEFKMDNISAAKMAYDINMNGSQKWSILFKGEQKEKKKPFLIGAGKEAVAAKESVKLNSPMFEINLNGDGSSFNGKLTAAVSSLIYEPQNVKISKIDASLPFNYKGSTKLFSLDGKLNITGLASVPVKSKVQLLKDSVVKADLSYKLNPIKLNPNLIKKFYTDQKILSGMDFNADITADGDIIFAGDQLTHTIKIDLDNGNFSILEKKIDISGINTSLSFNGFSDIKALPAQMLSIDKINIKDLRLSDAQVRYTIESTPKSAVLIENASFNWCDGKVISESMRFSSGQDTYQVSLFCDRLKLSSILQEVGAFNAEGEGTLNGRIPVSIKNGDISFDNGFLYSTPGKGGTIKVYGTDKLTAGIPEGTPQFNQLDLAKEALKSYKYDWARLGFDTKGDQLLVKMEFEGKPENALPFVYKKELGSFVRVNADNPGSNFQGININVNLQLPFNRVLKFGNELNNLFK